MQPLVSVIVPVYNAEAHLRQTLDCICGQNLREIEIILVDDGSTDSTLDILKQYEANDSRIILLQQEHEFAGAARNKGMDIARGKYFSFLDADDLFEPDMLKKMVTRAEEEHADVVICRCEEFYTAGNFTPLSWQIKNQYLKNLNRTHFSLRKDYPQATFQTFIGWPWDKLFRADYVKQNHFTFGPTRHGNDGPFVFPALAGADCISIIDEPLVKYRRSATQISNSSNISKHPTAGCTSIDYIHEKMKQMELPKGVWQSFLVWVAQYICWNMAKLNPDGREKLREYLRNVYNDKYQIVNRLKECSDDSACAEIYKASHKNIKAYTNMITPAISVVLPIYNAGPYLREALDSLLNQTFENFEAICVNDGSKDNSLEILHEYASKDSRIRVLDGPNGGYGKAMNRGMAAATGKYLAILEPDDVLPRESYARLYKCAEEHQLDIAKGCVSRFIDEKGTRNFYETTSFTKAQRDRLITPQNELSVYAVNMNTWTCLYRLDFLREHKILHHETPGAQYQDNGLFFLSFAHAKRVMLINDVVYHCRRDNPNSSVHVLTNRPWSMRNEYAYIRAKLEETPEVWEILKPAYIFKRWIAHLNTYGRIPNGIKMEYLHDLRKEMLEFETCDLSLMRPQHKTDYLNLLISPEFMLTQTAINSAVEHKIIKKLSKEIQSQFTKTISTCHKKAEAELKSPWVKESESSTWGGIPLWVVRRRQEKTTLYLLGFIPLWSRNIKDGRMIHRLFGIRVKHKRIAHK